MIEIHPTPPHLPARGARLLAPLALALLVSAAATATPAGATTSAWEENPESRVRLVSPWAAAPASGEILLGLHFRLSPGWHVYWKNSGDAGYPPHVELIDSPALSEPEILWPAPHRYELPGDLVAFGYGDEVVYPVRVAIDAEPGSTTAITADVDYLVCEVDCVPYRYQLRLEQPIAAAGTEPVPDPQTAPLVDAWVGRLPVDAGSRQADGLTTRAAIDTTDPERPVLEVAVDGGRPTEATDLFLEQSDQLAAGDPEQIGGDGAEGLLFRVPLEYRSRPDGGLRDVALSWVITGLEPTGAAGEGGPLALAARRDVPAVAGGLAALDPALPGDATGPRRPGDATPFALLARSFLAGLLLNLAPGVLALALALLLGAGAAADPRRTSLATAGGALAAGVGLGLGAAAADAAGVVAVWGLPLQAPATGAVLALGALLLALWLWKIWGRSDARLSGDLVPRAAAGGGALLPVLALGWAVPPIPESLGASLADGPVLGLAAALALAAGLALPHAAAAFAPAHLASLPRAGRRLREALGFLAATGVVWLLYVLAGTLASEELAYVELALLGVALLAWARHRAAGRPILATTLGLALVAVAVGLVWLAARSGAAGSISQSSLSTLF